MTLMDPGQGDDLASNYLDRLRRLEETLTTLGAAGGRALFSAAPLLIIWPGDEEANEFGPNPRLVETSADPILEGAL